MIAQVQQAFRLNTALIGALSLLPIATMPLPAVAQTIQQPIESGLAGEVWHLQQVVYGNDETITIEEPHNYTLEFGFDGSLLLQADCNYGRGVYDDAASSLSLEVGLLTRAACPPDSYSDRFLTDLDNVVSYILEDGTLSLSLFADGGILTFTRPQPVQPLPLSLRPTPDLVGPVWNLTGISYPGYQIVLTELGEYTLIFDEDDSVAVRADCNISIGTYAQSLNELTIALGPTTLAACADNSLSDQFLRDLSSAATYSLEEGRLSIQLRDDGGSLVFEVLEPTPYN